MIHSNELLKHRKFLPLFITQLLGALNDNVLRGAISIFITYSLVSDINQATFWTQIATAMFILPTLLFSAISGELADKYKKVYLLRGAKLAEIFIVLMTSYFFLTDMPSPLALMVCIFLMGAHSAVFSPAKFAYLPEYLEPDELLPANGLIEGSTFAVIAIGSGLSTLVGHSGYGIPTIISLMIIFSVVGWLSSILIPGNRAQNPNLKVKLNFITSTQEKIDFCTSNEKVWIPILGISWFWVIGMVHMTNLAT